MAQTWFFFSGIVKEKKADQYINVVPTGKKRGRLITYSEDFDRYGVGDTIYLCCDQNDFGVYVVHCYLFKDELEFKEALDLDKALSNLEKDTHKNLVSFLDLKSRQAKLESFDDFFNRSLPITIQANGDDDSQPWFAANRTYGFFDFFNLIKSLKTRKGDTLPNLMQAFSDSSVEFGYVAIPHKIKLKKINDVTELNSRIPAQGVFKIGESFYNIYEHSTFIVKDEHVSVWGDYLKPHIGVEINLCAFLRVPPTDNIQGILRESYEVPSSPVFLI